MLQALHRLCERMHTGRFQCIARATGLQESITVRAHRRIVVAVFMIGVLGIAAWGALRPGEDAAARVAPAATPSMPEPVAAPTASAATAFEVPTDPNDAAQDDTSLVATPAPSVTLAAPCLAASDVLSHPLVAAELQRLAPVMAHGSMFEVFRGLDRGAVRSMAIQGDSAAMLLLARMHMAAARGAPDEQALARSTLERTVNTNRTALPEVSADERDEQRAQARYWLEQAALHGRVLALRELGRLEQRNGETVISKGWITQEAFDALDAKSRRSLVISNVYIAMVDLLIPELFTGLAADGLGRLPDADVAQPLAIAAADQFMNALTDAGKRLPEIAATDSAEALAELEKTLCSRR